jgi:hypothetical protein
MGEEVSSPHRVAPFPGARLCQPGKASPAVAWVGATASTERGFYRSK